jgi:arabinogalactan endo-1,4-beta-galactosidase
LFTTSCNSQTNEDQNLISATIDSGFAKGADVGWLPQMEATDINFMILTELKETVYSFERQGMNTIRLRVFVNPSDDKVSGHCSKEEMVAMALRKEWE